MSTDRSDTSTVREVSAAPSARSQRPVLLIGSCAPRTARVVSVDRPVTVGRGRRSDGGVRDRDADVILHSDALLSRAHLRIAPNGPSRGWQLEDLGSKNGTYLDGRRVKKPTPLSDGSIVCFGAHAGVFRCVSEEELE